MILAAIVIIRALMSCLLMVALLLRLLRCRVWWWNLVWTTSLGSLLLLLARLRTRRRLFVLTASLGSLLLFLSWLLPRSIILHHLARRTSSRMRNGLLSFFLMWRRLVVKIVLTTFMFMSRGSPWWIFECFTPPANLFFHFGCFTCCGKNMSMTMGLVVHVRLFLLKHKCPLLWPVHFTSWRSCGVVTIIA